MTVLIGLMGPAGSGKSTIAQYLVDRYGAKRYSFAAPLKEFAQRVFDFTDEQLYGTQAQKEAGDERYGGHSPRWFLQRLGTEGFRGTFGEQFWVEQFMKKVASDNPPLAVCDDVRFKNEAEAIRQYGVGQLHDNHFQLSPTGFIWKLLPVATNSQADTSHASEQGWMQSPYDHVIAPIEYGLSSLHRLVDDACRRYKLFPKLRETPL